MLIDLDIDKAPLEIVITDDNIINLTGESGSGKSFFCNNFYKNDKYLVVDTDEIFKDKEGCNDLYKKIKNYFVQNYGEDYYKYFLVKFDEYYECLLKYFEDINKTLVIDSAQFRNLKDVSKLKGSLIVMRTSVNTCYKRCIERYKYNNPNISEEEMEKYVLKKKDMFEWYKFLNDFIIRVNNYRK